MEPTKVGPNGHILCPLGHTPPEGTLVVLERNKYQRLILRTICIEKKQKDPETNKELMNCNLGCFCKSETSRTTSWVQTSPPPVAHVQVLYKQTGSRVESFHDDKRTTPHKNPNANDVDHDKDELLGIVY
jgi:hypothetical protein